jgi:hypothetical protein
MSTLAWWEPPLPGVGTHVKLDVEVQAEVKHMDPPIVAVGVWSPPRFMPMMVKDKNVVAGPL